MSKLRPKSFAFFLEQINRSNRLRWLFSIGMGLVFLVVYWGTSHIKIIALLLAFYITASFGFTLAYRGIQTSTGDRTRKFKLLKRIAFSQAILDLIFITAGINFSGGSI